MSEDSEEDYSDRSISDEDESVCFLQPYLIYFEIKLVLCRFPGKVL